MTAPNTVQVANIAAKTEDNEIKDFFSFCGKITDIKVTSEGATTTVTFEKETAPKRALILNHNKFGESEITVTGSTDADKDSSCKHQDERDTDDMTSTVAIVEPTSDNPDRQRGLEPSEITVSTPEESHQVQEWVDLLESVVFMPFPTGLDLPDELAFQLRALQLQARAAAINFERYREEQK